MDTMEFRPNSNKISIQALKKSLEPCLHISIPLDYSRYGVMPLQFKGELVLQNQAIAILRESSNNYRSGHRSEIYFRNRGLRANEYYTYTLQLEADLSPKALLAIEEFREENNGDVKLSVVGKMRYFKSDIYKSDSTIKSSHPHTNEWSAIYINSNQQGILSRCEDEVVRSIEISSSDWIKEYLPIFGYGSFISYDLPIIKPELVTNEFKARVDEALASISDMEKARKRCEWNQVIKEARPVLEVVKKDKIRLERLLIDGGFTNQATSDFIEMLQKFHDYASKFIHKMERGNHIDPMPTIPAQREDGDFVYAMAINIVNVITKKIYRQFNS